MTCAANPHQITYDPLLQRLTFTWQRPVRYSDGMTSLGDDFEIVTASEDRIELRRLRDGSLGLLLLSPDAETYAFGVGRPETDPSFDFAYARCALAGS